MPKKLRRVFVRLTQPSFTVSAVGVVFDTEGRVLLLKHVLRANSSGWGLPGGFLNAGEHPETAVKRELIEEVGIDIFDIKLLKIRALGNHLEIIYSSRAGNAVEATPKSAEILAARWFRVDEIKNEIPRSELEHILRAAEISENP